MGILNETEQAAAAAATENGLRPAGTYKCRIALKPADPTYANLEHAQPAVLVCLSTSPPRHRSQAGCGKGTRLDERPPGECGWRDRIHVDSCAEWREPARAQGKGFGRNQNHSIDERKRTILTIHHVLRCSRLEGPEILDRRLNQTRTRSTGCPGNVGRHQTIFRVQQRMIRRRRFHG